MTTSLRVLLLSDEAGADLLLGELRRGLGALHFVRPETVEGLRQALDSPTWDVVVYEQGCLSFDILTVLACLEQSGLPLPVVIVTGHDGPDVAATAAALKAGVRGYVSKAPLSRLAPVVRQAIGEAEAERRRVLAEHQLHLLEETVGAVAQGILIADARAPDFPIRYVNRTFERMTDFAAGDLLGRGLEALHREGAEAFPLCEIQAALCAGCLTTAEWRHPRRDGSACWLEMIIKPIRDERGRLQQFLAVLSDQSYRKRLEEQLRLAQKMATVGRLVGGVAHDCNHLLTAILGYSEWLLRESRPESASHQNLLQIIEAGERAERLSRRLVQFSGDHPRATQILDVNAVVGDMMRLLHDLIGEDVELTLSLDPVAPVLADPVRMQQVLLNLVVDAREAMPQGGRLTVSTSEVFVGDSLASPDADSASGRYVQLAISNTGGNMSDRGNGPGLANVRDVVRQLAGFVEVDSQPGAGTTFRLFFPRAPKPVGAVGTAPVVLE